MKKKTRHFNLKKIVIFKFLQLYLLLFKNGENKIDMILFLFHVVLII